MNPEQLSNHPVAEAYEEEADSAADRNENSRTPARPDFDSSGDVSSLLRDVLGETLVRRQECVDDLLRILTEFRRQTSSAQMDESVFPRIVRVVLKHRLGESFNKLPEDLFVEVGKSLWDHETSRERVGRLWKALGAIR